MVAPTPLSKEKAMRRTILRPLAVTALLGAGACAPAFAQPYVGGSLGKGDVRADTINGAPVGDTRGAAFKGYGGYQFTPNFGVEVGGARLGKFEATDGHANAAFVDAVGTLPLTERWSALGRLGLAHTRVNAGGAHDTGTGPKVGLGAQYNFNKTTALRTEWERYRVDAFGNRRNADMVSVGVNVGF
jgi:OmpA-OmpF porin, OOP family